MKKIQLILLLLLVQYLSYAQPNYGSATGITGGYRMTSGPTQVGAFWMAPPANFHQKFTVTFNAKIDAAGPGPADGICAVFTAGTPTFDVNRFGHRLGYLNDPLVLIPSYLPFDTKSLAVRYDNYYNDPSVGDLASGRDNVSVNTNASFTPLAGPVTILPGPGTVHDNVLRNYKIEWTPPCTLKVLVDGNLRITTTSFSPQSLWTTTESENITWGFTAATGSLWCNQDITDVVMTTQDPIGICVGQTKTPGSAGGTWSSDNIGVATVNSLGQITGQAVGTAMITHDVVTPCPGRITYKVIVVYPSVAGVISGPDTVCGDTTCAYINTGGTPGGIWSTSNVSIAPIDPVTGVATFNPVTSLTTITITYTTSGPCPVSTNFSVVLNPSPIVSIWASPNPVCEGQLVTFSSSVSSCMGCTYDWYVEPPYASYGTTPSITMIASAGFYYPYKLTVTNTYGCRATDELELIVLSRPEAGEVSCPRDFCANEEGTHTCVVTGNTNLGTWSLTGGGTWISIDASGNINIDNPPPTPVTVTVHYTVVDACGSDDAECSFTVFPAPTVSTSASPNPVCEGHMVTLSSSVTNCLGCTYDWYVTPPYSSWGTTPSITFMASAGFFYYYSLTVTNTYGCYATDQLELNVVKKPKAGQVSCPRDFCANEVGPHICTVSGNSMLGTWVLTGGGTWVTIDASGVLHVNPALPIPVTCTVSYVVVSSPCDPVVAQCKFTVYPSPTISGPSVVCQKDPITLTTTIPGGTWSTSDPAVAVITTIGPLTAVVVGGATGTATLTYTVGRCPAYHTITVGAKPTPIFLQCAATGCEGVPYPVYVYPDPAYAGWPYSWSWSGVINVVPTSSSTAMVTGMSVGTGIITYTVVDPVTHCEGSAYCHVTMFGPGILGTVDLCEGATTTLAVPPGTPGTWSSSNPAVADVNSVTGEVSGLASGTALVTFDVVSTYGNCDANYLVNVQPQPEACVDWGPSSTPPVHNAFIFTGTVGAIVNFTVECGGVSVASGSITLTGGADEFWMPGLSTDCQLCITNVSTPLCSIAGTCCAFVGAPKAGHTTTGTATVVRNTTELVIVPNPNTGTFKLSGHLQELTNLKEVTIEITDMLGKTLLTETVPVKNGGIEENIAMREVANGVYMVKIKGDHVNQVLRFVVDK